MNNYDVCRMGRYTRNILQWNKNDIKSMKMMTGNYEDDGYIAVVRKD